MRWPSFAWTEVRRVLRRGAVGWAAGILALIGLLWIGAAQGIGMGLVVPAVLRRLAPAGWSVQVGTVDGDWGSRLRVRDLEVRGTGVRASVSEMRIRFRLLPLLSRTIDVPELSVLGARGELRSGPTSSHRSGRAAVSPDGLAFLTSSPLGGWLLQIGDLTLRQGALRIVSDGGTVEVRDARVKARANLAPSGLDMDLDSLAAKVARSDAHGERTGPARFSLSAALHGGLLDVRSLSLTSARSHVKGGGTLPLTHLRSHVEGVDFALRASPVDVRDLPLTLPAAVLSNPTARGTLTAIGAGDSVAVEATIDGPAGLGGELFAALRPEASKQGMLADSVRALDARLDWRADLTGWTSAPVKGDLSGRLEVSLDRLASDADVQARGTVVRRPPPGASKTLTAGPLRADFDVTRPAPPSAGSPAEIGVTATLYRGAPAPAAGWTRLGFVEADVTSRRASWRLDLAVDSASARGRGSASWGGGRRRITVDGLSVARLDAAELRTALPHTSISGHVTGHVGGVSSRRLRGEVQLALGRSSVDERRLDTLSLVARLAPGLIQGHLAALAGSRSLGTDYRVAIGDTLLAASLTALRLTEEATSAQPQPSPLPIDLRASATGTWHLRSSIRRASFEVTIDTTTVPTLSLMDGHVRGRIDGDSIAVDADVDVRPSSVGPVSVRAELRGSGLSPSEWRGAVTASALRRRRAAHAPPERVDTLALEVSVPDPGRFVLDGRFRPAEGGHLRIEGHASVDSVASFDLTADGALHDSVDLLGGATLDSLVASAAGSHDSSGWRRLHGRIAVRDAVWKGLTADTIGAMVRSDPSGLTLDTLTLVSNVLVLGGRGTLPAPGVDATGRLELRGNRLDLGPLKPLSPIALPTLGNGEIQMDVTGRLDSLELAGSLRLGALSYDSGLRVRGLDLDGQASVRSPFRRALGLTAGTAHLRLARLALPDAEVRSIDVQAEGGPDSVSVVAAAQIDDDRSGRMHLRVDPRPGRRNVRIDRLDLSLGRDRWHLREPAVFSYLGGYRVDSLALEDGGSQAIRVEGGLDARDSLDLRVDVDSTSVSSVADLLGFPTLRGSIDGSARLRGTTSSPRGNVRLSVGFDGPGTGPTLADLVLDAVGDSLTAELRLDGPAGGRARALASLPLPRARTGGETVDVALNADSLRLAFLLPFLPADVVSDLDGRLDADVTVHGSSGQLRLDGPVSLRARRVRLPRLGVEWRDVLVSARGSGGDLVIDTARVSSGSGGMTASGRISVSDSLALDLEARLQDFRAIHNDAYRADVSGRVQAVGTLTAPVLSGRLQVQTLDAYLGQRVSTSGVEAVELTQADLQELRERFGYVPQLDHGRRSSSALDRLAADLVVELGRDSWVRKRADPELAVAFTGNVHVRLRPGEQPALDGSVQTIEGRGFVKQFGKRFELREGTVTFDGPPSDARIDLSATYTIPSRDNPDDAEATIVLGLSGTADSLSLALSSQPQMENADIVSYIATGRPASGSLALGADSSSAGSASQGGLLAAGESLALGQLTSLIENTAERTVGLDVVEIRRQGLREATLVAGKYVSPRLYVGFAQPVTIQEGGGLSLGGQGQSQVEIELEALRWLLLNVEGSGSSVRVFLTGRRAY